MLKIKEWKYDEIMEKALNFGDVAANLDVERTDDDDIRQVKRVDGYVTFTCRSEVLKETEKAVYVRLGDAWNTWIPKSAIA